MIIFANGVMPDPDAARTLLRTGDRIVCADAGARHARRLGLVPDLVVGDLDSLPDDDREWLLAKQVQIIQYPHDKDQTDLELALEHALAEDPGVIIIVAALGARLDHTLGNIALLADERLAARQVSLDDGIEEVCLCRGEIDVHGSPGDLLSLVPWGADVQGVRTGGLRWALRGETLHADRSRGISNEMTGETASVGIESGSLLVVHRRQRPYAAAPEVK